MIMSIGTREERFNIKVEGSRIEGIIHFPQSTDYPLVVASHGLFSSKDTDKWRLFGNSFSERGIAFIRFDHRGCGESEGKLLNSINLILSQRVADLQGILNFVRNSLNHKGKIGLIGSSLGGSVVIISGASHQNEITSIVTLACPASFKGLRKSGEEINRGFLDDIEEYDLNNLIKQVRSSILLIHGSLDRSVPSSHSKTLFEAANNPKKLIIIEGGDHTFSDPSHQKAVMSSSLEWFLSYF